MENRELEAQKSLHSSPPTIGDNFFDAMLVIWFHAGGQLELFQNKYHTYNVENKNIFNEPA